MEFALGLLLLGALVLAAVGIILSTWYGGRAWGGWYAVGSFLFASVLFRLSPLVALLVEALIISRARGDLRARAPATSGKPVDVDAFD